MTPSARRASGVAPSELDGVAPGARVPNLLGPSFDSVTPERPPAPAVEPAVRPFTQAVIAHEQNCRATGMTLRAFQQALEHRRQRLGLVHGMKPLNQVGQRCR